MARENDLAATDCALGKHTWSVMLSMTEPWLSNRTIGLGCAPLPPVFGVPYTLIGFWAGVSSIFPSRKWTSITDHWHKIFTPLIGGICRWSWKGFTSLCLGMKMNVPPRPSNCHSRLGRSLTPWSTWTCSPFGTSLHHRGQVRIT
jgi:hypothetical protein